MSSTARRAAALVPSVAPPFVIARIWASNSRMRACAISMASAETLSRISSIAACEACITAALMMTSRKVTTMITVVKTSTNAGHGFCSPSAEAPAMKRPFPKP
jgi:hypothetical protein